MYHYWYSLLKCPVIGTFTLVSDLRHQLLIPNNNVGFLSCYYIVMTWLISGNYIVNTVKLQYTTPRRFRVGSAYSANKPKQTQNRNEPRIQTQNTKGFRLPRLQGAVYCNLAVNTTNST